MRTSYIILVTVLAILLILLFIVGIVIWLVVFETPKNAKKETTRQYITNELASISSTSVVMSEPTTTTTTMTTVISTTTTSLTSVKTTRKPSDNLCRNGGIYLYEIKKCVCKDNVFSGEFCEIVANCDLIPDDSGDCVALAELDLDADTFAGACPRTVYC